MHRVTFDDTPKRTAVEARMFSASELLFNLQHTIETQRGQLLCNGGRPDAVLLGPTAWRVVENYMRDSQAIYPVVYTPSVCSIGALRVIRCMDEEITVVQTCASEPRRMRQWSEHAETPSPDEHPFNQTPTTCTE